MIRNLFRTAAIVAALPVLAVAMRPAFASNAEAEAAIAALDQKLVTALAAKDAEALSMVYAPDAVFAASGLGSLKGREAIKAGFMELFKDANFSGKETSQVFTASESGDMGMLVATYEVTMTSPETHEKTVAMGTNVTTYRKVASGAWMVVSDMNVDDPMH